MVKLADKDDIEHMPQWKRIIYHCSPLFSLLSLGAYWLYFIYRVKYTLDAQRLANKVFYMAWTFIMVEMGVACKLPYPYEVVNPMSRSWVSRGSRSWLTLAFSSSHVPSPVVVVFDAQGSQTAKTSTGRRHLSHGGCVCDVLRRGGRHRARHDSGCLRG